MPDRCFLRRYLMKAEAAIGIAMCASAEWHVKAACDALRDLADELEKRELARLEFEKMPSPIKPSRAGTSNRA